MPRKLKQILLAALTLVLITVSITVFMQSYSVPRFDVTPIQKNSPALSQQEVEGLLAKQFKIIWRVRQVPQAIKQSFSNVAGFPFRFADPGEPMSNDDMSSGGPSRRLVFVGLGDRVAVLVYEQGGFVNSFIAVIFSYVDRGSAWAATSYSAVRDITGLRRVVHSERFQVLESLPR
jgi:hypothetical protein